jgi:hypothetical protein
MFCSRKIIFLVLCLEPADHNTSSNSGLIKYQASCKLHKNITQNKCNKKGDPQNLLNLILPGVEKRHVFAVFFFQVQPYVMFKLSQKGELFYGNVDKFVSVHILVKLIYKNLST